MTQLNHICFYLDPTTEKNDVLFRFGTLKSILLPSIHALKQSNPSLKISLCTSVFLLNEAKKEGLNLEGIDVYKLSNKAFDKIPNLNDKIINKNIDNNTLNIINSYLSKSLKELSEPDLIISYETSINYLKKIFPNSIHLHQTFGAFSRAPFALFDSFNPLESLGNSFQNKFEKDLKKETLSLDEKDLLRKYRGQVIRGIAELTPFKKYISNIYDEYSSAVLLACQVDDYFAFTGCSEYKTQEELVNYVLQTLPDDVAVIVTEHAYSRSLSESTVEKLTKKHHNFKYLSENIPTISQFLAPYIDGIVCVSSSMAYQAAFWQKPLWIIGDSQMSIFRTADDNHKFIKQVKQHSYIDRDNVFYHLVSAIQVSHKFELFDGKKLYARLNDLFSNIKQNGITYNLFKRKNVYEMHKIFTQDNRLGAMRNELKILGVNSQTDHLRVAMGSGIEVVSFDLFDTLAERDFIEPWELFKFIEPRVRQAIGNRNFAFCDWRRRAEGETRSPTKGEFEITIDEIYDTFKKLTFLNDSQCELIKQIEKDAELQLIHKKHKMYREYQFCKLVAKKRAIITDIYLEKYDIEKILKKIGIADYDILLSSATSKTRKQNGTLFVDYLDILKEENIDTNKCLHVGDNSLADGKMAKEHGLKSYVLPKAMDNFYKSKIGKTFNSTFIQKNTSTSIVNGLIANKFYGESWNKIENDTLFNGSNYRYGYEAIGPLVLGFVQWLYYNAKKNNIKKLYFLARDGYILKKAFDILYSDDKSISTDYLLASRRSVIVPAIFDFNDIVEFASLNFNARTLDSFLLNRFGIDFKTIPKNILKKHNYKSSTIVSPHYRFAELLSFLKDIANIIIDNSKVERDNYLTYLEQKQFLFSLKEYSEKEIALIDIGYSGTMQFYLSKILNKQMNGYYFLTHHFVRNDYKNAIFEGYLANLDDHRSCYHHSLNDFVFIFESAFSSLDGSLLKFEKNTDGTLEPIFIEAEEEKVRQQALSRIHTGVYDFILDVNYRFGSYKFDFDLPSLVASRLLLNFSQHPSKKDASLFLNLEVENLFGGGSVKLINTINKSKLEATEITRLIRTSHWKLGAKAYYHNINGNPIILENNIIKGTNNKDIKNAKRIKLKRNPYVFFKDSKKKGAKKVSVLFNPKTKLGRLNSKVIRLFV